MVNDVWIDGLLDERRTYSRTAVWSGAVQAYFDNQHTQTQQVGVVSYTLRVRPPTNNLAAAGSYYCCSSVVGLCWGYGLFVMMNKPLLYVIFQCMLQQLVFAMYLYSPANREIDVEIDQSSINIIHHQNETFSFF